MLRLAVLLLVLANAGYFAWSQGLLRAWGLAPAQQSEPHRIRQQIKPQSLRILRDDEARRQDTTAALPKPVECLQAGPFDESQMAVLAQALNSWPAGSWSVEPLTDPRGQLLKLTAVDDSLRPRLQELRTALSGRTLRPCR